MEIIDRLNSIGLNVKDVDKLGDIADQLMTIGSFSYYEAIDLAIKISNQQLLKKALVISSDDKLPGAIESIAISLGQKS